MARTGVTIASKMLVLAAVLGAMLGASATAQVCPTNPGGTCRGHGGCSPPAGGVCTDTVTECECRAPSTSHASPIHTGPMIAGADIHTLTTAQGGVSVYLPNDMAAGDTISGVVYAEPQGNNDAERRSNADTLNGYVVDVGDAHVRVADHVLRYVVPAGAGALRLVLRNSARSIGAANVPLAAPAATPAQMSVAPFAQAGRPMQVLGPFDGDLTNTQAAIGGHSALVLAESPRQAVLLSPNTPTGPVSVEVREGTHNISAVYNNVSVSLSAPRTTLARGERGVITLQVQGLQGLHTAVSVELRASPTISLQGGNQQVIPITPNAFNPQGAFSRQIPFRVVAVGPFDVTARLNASQSR